MLFLKTEVNEGVLRRGEEGWLSRQKPRGGRRGGAANVIVGPKHFTLCQRLGRSEVAKTAAAPGSAERGALGWDPGRRAPSREQGSRGAELLAPRLTPARRPFPAGSRGVKAREQRELPPPPPAAARLWKYDLK